MRHGIVWAVLIGIAIMAPVQASFFDVFLDGFYSDPNFWDNPNDHNCGYYGVEFDTLYLDPNLYDPNVVAWDCDNPMWQVWNVFGVAAVWVDPNGLNLWTSKLPTWFAGFVGALVNTPPYGYRLYPDMGQDPNLSETFFSKEKSHYEICYMRWIDPNKGEGYIGHHVSPQGWTGMFLGVQQHPGEQPYVYMHCAPDGGLKWYGPGGTFNLDLAQGVWMLFEYDADGDTSVPNAPAGVPLWKSAVWNGDKYADAPTNWSDNSRVMVSRADTGQPLVYKHFGSWQPDASHYAFHERGVSLMGVYGTSMEDIPGWVVVNHVECRGAGAEFSHVARKLTMDLTHMNWGSIEVDPMLPAPDNDPNFPESLRLRYTNGTKVVLTATPISGKAFKEWQIWDDPNKYPDANFAVSDSNSVLSLIMDKDYVVASDFKCGSGLAPFVGAVLLVLGAGVIVRRLA